MKHSDFRIGTEFTTGTGRWRCTDIGTRTIVAIKLDHDDDPSWYHGPPYAIEETIFDEETIATCRRARSKTSCTQPASLGDAPRQPRPFDFSKAKRVNFPNLQFTVPAIYAEPPTREPILGRLIRELLEAHALTPRQLAEHMAPKSKGRKPTRRREPDAESGDLSPEEWRTCISDSVEAAIAPCPDQNDLCLDSDLMFALDRVFGFELGHFAHVFEADYARECAVTRVEFFAHIKPLTCTTQRQRALRDCAPVWNQREPFAR